MSKIPWRIGDMRRVAAWLGPSRPVVIVSYDPEVSKLGLEVEDMSAFAPQGEAGRESFQITVRRNVPKQTGVAKASLGDVVPLAPPSSDYVLGMHDGKFAWVRVDLCGKAVEASPPGPRKVFVALPTA